MRRCFPHVLGGEIQSYGLWKGACTYSLPALCSCYSLSSSIFGFPLLINQQINPKSHAQHTYPWFAAPGGGRGVLSISHCLSPGQEPLWEPPVDFLATSVCQHCGNVNLDIRLHVPGSFPKHVLPSLHQFKYFSWNLHPWLKEFNS